MASREVGVSLLTFARRNPKDQVSVRFEVAAINRLLERAYPDCTCRISKVGDVGMPSEWITVELEITSESSACLDWYLEQTTARRLMLSAWKPRQDPSFEADLASALIARRA